MTDTQKRFLHRLHAADGSMVVRSHDVRTARSLERKGHVDVSTEGGDIVATFVRRDRLLVAFLDPLSGLPRAWGVSSDRGEAEAEARRQLAAYCAKKAELHDDPAMCDPAQYTICEVVIMPMRMS